MRSKCLGIRNTEREHEIKKWAANTFNTYMMFFTAPPSVEQSNVFFNIQNWGAPWTYLWMGLLFCVSHTHSFCRSLVASCFMPDPTFCPIFCPGLPSTFFQRVLRPLFVKLTSVGRSRITDGLKGRVWRKDVHKNKEGLENETQISHRLVDARSPLDSGCFTKGGLLSI